MTINPLMVIALILMAILAILLFPHLKEWE